MSHFTGETTSQQRENEKVGELGLGLVFSDF